MGLPLAIVSRLAKVPLPALGQAGLFALSGQGVLEECYTKAGFRDVAVRAVSVQRRFPSTAEAVSAMKESFPRLQTLLTKLSDADRELAWNEIEQQLSQFEGRTVSARPESGLLESERSKAAFGAIVDSHKRNLEQRKTGATTYVIRGAK